VRGQVRFVLPKYAARAWSADKTAERVLERHLDAFAGVVRKNSIRAIGG
jgi:hypothetical protein